MTDMHHMKDAEPIDESAMDSWRTRAEERRSNRKRTGLMGTKDAFVSLPAWQRWGIVVPTVILGMTALLVGVDLAASAGRIHPGVIASGVKVGGLSVEAASERLATTLPDRMKLPVHVTYEGESWDLTSQDLLASPETTAAAQAAFNIGRRGEFFDIVATRAAAWFRPVRVDVPVTSDASATTTAVGAIVARIDKQPTDASIAIDGTTPSLIPAVVGLKADPEVLRKEILTAMVGTDKTVVVDVAFVPVRVTDEGAGQALADVKQILSGPVTVTYESKNWVFTAAEIAQWVDFRIVQAETNTAGTVASTDSPEPASPVGTELLEAYVSADEASKTLTARVGEAGKPAVNASFKASGGVVNIVPGQDGVGPDVASLAKEMTVVLKGGGTRSLQLRTLRVEPEITTEEARGMGIKERISSYTTTYDAGNKPRVNNIHTLADAIDHTLIAPGATFSFNGSVGPRTAAKGYQEAPAIVNGKLVPQLGGGICQVGTTIFNTVFESGFPVVERKNHSFYISHYPKGRDATVSWGGPDFKFKNDSSSWVLLVTGHTSSSLTISLYGTDPGYDVSSSTGSWTDIKPHPVKETPDPTLAVGKRIIQDSGVDGKTIIVTRTVKRGGALVREDKFKSVYKTKEEVVLVGTAPVPGTTPTTTP